MTKACLFNEMPEKDRVDFFQKCQENIIKNHGNNSFLLNSKNKNEILSFYKKLILKYKGYCYSSDTICILFNVVKLIDNGPITSIASWNSSPAKDGDMYFVDYVVGKIDEETYQELKLVMNFPGVSKISFARNGHQSTFDLDKFEKTLVLGIKRGIVRGLI